ncbi:MAG: restriction endonuclease subunit S [Prevotellaceae bacterium]|nr:restriction endonuclease subunit S [Prevotellaceae bacterium]
MMEIKRGYKQTDIGVVPEDWEVVEFEKIFKCLSTATYSRAEEVESEGILYVHYGDIHTKWNHFVDFDKNVLPRIPKSRIKNFALIQNGDLIIADASEDYVGLCKSVEAKNPSNQVAISGLHTILARDITNKFRNGYKGYLLQSVGVKEQLERLATGIKVYGVSKQNLQTVLLAVPTIKEQEAIAEVLSDIDSLIEALDEKIAKKQAIKEGAMQQLLTGKKRLAGFSEPWVEKKLREVAEMYSGGTPLSSNPLYYDGNIPFLTISDISYSRKYILKTENSITKLGLQNSSARMFETGTLMYAMYATLGKCSLTKIDLSCSQAILGITPNEVLINSCFLYYLLLSKEKEVADLGQMGAQSNLSKTIVQDINLVIPPDIKEQQAIAKILTDMDNEIEQLEKEQQKYTALKQGAIQQLLTGQIRLVNTSSRHRTIPIAAHIIGGHVVNILYGSKGWGRTKLQKSIHLVGYCCQLDFGNEYIRNTAGPDDQLLMKYIDGKFKQYRHIRIETKRDSRGGKYYDYIPTSIITEIEQIFETYPTETKQTINDLLNKIKKMDLARTEIVSTLYAVWNNRIIKGQSINDDLLLIDFYDWSEHKSDFGRDLVLRGLNYMRQEGIIPVGWGKYIDKKK